MDSEPDHHITSAAVAGAAGSVAEPAGAWRRHVVDLIRDSGPDRWIECNGLFSCINDEIPLHNASRAWRSKHPTAQNFPVPAEMRWHLFVAELSQLPFDCDPPSPDGARRKLKRSTMIRPLFRPCVECGRAYFGRNDTKACSASCSGKNAKRVSVPAAFGQNPSRGKKQIMPRLPETIAIDTIVTALQALPDQAARDRVMTFVNACQFADHAADPTRANGQIPAELATIQEDNPGG
jgi:hypothetical protein